MTDSEIIEVLKLCHPVYLNLHHKIGHNLTQRETTLLRQFKSVWENDLCLRPDLVKQSGVDHREIAFLGGYVYYAQGLLVS